MRSTAEDENGDVWIRSDGEKLIVVAIEDSSSLLMIDSNGRHCFWPLIALDAYGYKRKRQNMGHNVDFGSEKEVERKLVAGPDVAKIQINDPINRPAHYTAGRKFEPVDVIRDWGLNFSLGNAVKYVSRAGRKDPAKTIEDLKKAIWYIQNEIDSIEKSK